jgi:hypothetical protein
MATVKTDSLILVVVLRKGYTADVSATLRFVSIGTFFRPATRLRFLRQGLGPAYSLLAPASIRREVSLCPACLVALFPVAEE